MASRPTAETQRGTDMPDTTIASLLPEARQAAAAELPLPDGDSFWEGKDDAAIQRRRDAIRRAEASLALEGMMPYGESYERQREAVIAGHMTIEAAIAETSAEFGPDVEFE